MKEKKPTRNAVRRTPGAAELKAMAGIDKLQQWISWTLVHALHLKAAEIRYERGKDGLTVQFRKGSEVLESMGPGRQFQDEAIPRLVKMGEQCLPRRSRGETGRFLYVSGGREWNTPMFHTRTESGERMVVRFTSSKPWKGLRNLRLFVNATILRAVATRATEVHYERGKDGLAVKYLRGTRVLGTHGCPERFQDKVIPRLRKLAKMGPAKKGGRLTGKYDGIVDGVVWSFHTTGTATRSGERLVIRPSGPKPGKETK